MMKKLANYLQKQPIIILVMFLITVISGIISIVLGWKSFYNDFLSKKLELPIWFLLLLGLIIVLIYIFRPTKSNLKDIELEIIVGKTFGVQQIEMDGKKFVNCSFDGSELIFKGENAFALEGNTFNGPPRLKFTDSASITVAVLQGFHRSHEFKEYITQLFPCKEI